MSLATLLLGAACSSSTPAAVETPEPSASPTATSPSLPTATTSPTQTATRAPVVPTGTESPAPLGQPTCTASAVTIIDADTVVKPEYRAEVYTLRTTGAPCELRGYPRVVVSGATVTPGGEGLPPEAVASYTLSKATTLSFAVATSRSGSCTEQSAITVTLPGTATPKRVATTLRVCNGRLGVTPVHRAGDDD